jgi:hypothetical protein
MANASVETFYGAAARSMSQNWHDFLFGSFDPAGTVTVDKLPGALWVQALSLRIFGFHIWALVLPQAVEGVATVLVLYHAVRRLAGPVAGLAAAVALAATPVTVLLGRGNVSDSLLILLLVLAADATTVALSTGKLRWLLLAGAWVGLAFQAKMVQAWHRHLWPGGSVHPGQRPRGAADRRLPGRRGGSDPGHRAVRCPHRVRAPVPAAHPAREPRSAGALDRGQLRARADRDVQPADPVRLLPLLARRGRPRPPP